MDPSASEIAEMLVDRIEDVCWKLFPEGKVEGDWFGAEGWQGDPLLDIPFPRPILSVGVSPDDPFRGWSLRHWRGREARAAGSVIPMTFS